MSGPKYLPPPPSGVVFPLPELQVSPSQPVVVEGPVGSAKSTVIRQAVRECQARHVPSVYISTRGNWIGLTKYHVCEAINYPESPSVLSQLVSREITAYQREKEHLREALEDLVQVATEVGLERKNNPSIPEADKAPLVAFDNLDELLQEVPPGVQYRVVDESSGLVDTFLRKLGHVSMEQGLVKVAVSSVDPMVLGIDKGSERPLGFHRQYIEDPPVEDVRKALLSLNWKPEQAEQALNACGARRMLLNGLLHDRAVHAESCPDHPTGFGPDNQYKRCACDLSNGRLELTVGSAKSAAAMRAIHLLHDVKAAPEEKRQLKQVLDKLASYPLASSHEAKIRLQDLPAPYREPTMAYGLFLRPDPAAKNSREKATVLFETEGDRQAWIERSRRIEQEDRRWFPWFQPVRQ